MKKITRYLPKYYWVIRNNQGQPVKFKYICESCHEVHIIEWQKLSQPSNPFTQCTNEISEHPKHWDDYSGYK